MRENSNSINTNTSRANILIKENVSRITKKWICYNENLIKNKEYDEIPLDFFKMILGAEV